MEGLVAGPGVLSTVRIVVMRGLDPDSLDLWILEWRRGLDDSEELFVGLGLPINVVQAALGELEGRYRGTGKKKVGRGGGGWERRVLGYLEEFVKAGVRLWSLFARSTRMQWTNSSACSAKSATT
jgi:hypothetical protein